MPRAKYALPAAKALVFAACLVPLAVLGWKLFHGTLRPDPVERLTHTTGLTALILLLVSLAVTPLRRLTGFNVLLRFRRLIGLFAFTYVVLHFLIFLVFEHFFSWPSIAEDILERRYITVGFLAFLILIPVAATSTKGWIRRLGGKRWARLHQMVYVAAALAVLHFLWLVKLDTREPVIYASILIGLLAVRLRGARRDRTRARRAKRAKGLGGVRTALGGQPQAADESGDLLS